MSAGRGGLRTRPAFHFQVMKKFLLLLLLLISPFLAHAEFRNDTGWDDGLNLYRISDSVSRSDPWFSHNLSDMNSSLPLFDYYSGNVQLSETHGGIVSMSTLTYGSASELYLIRRLICIAIGIQVFHVIKHGFRPQV